MRYSTNWFWQFLLDNPCISEISSFSQSLLTRKFVRWKAKKRSLKWWLQKHTTFSEKRPFLTPWYSHIRFPKNMAWFVFLKPPFRDSPFCLITKVLWHLSILLRNYFKIIVQIDLPFRLHICACSNVILGC